MGGIEITPETPARLQLPSDTKPEWECCHHSLGETVSVFNRRLFLLSNPHNSELRQPQFPQVIKRLGEIIDSYGKHKIPPVAEDTHVSF